MMPQPSEEWAPAALGDRPFIKEIGDRRVWMLLFMRASALQGAHPVVAQGIVDHSRIWTEPTGRIPETIRYGIEMFLGNEQPRTAAEIRDIHRNMSGTLDDGSRYHAWNREVWAWVHLTSVEALLFALDACFGPLDPAEVDRLYQQSRDSAHLYGVPDTLVPATVEELRTHINRELRTMSDSAATIKLHEFAELQLGLLLPGPPAVSAALAKVFGPWLRSLTYGTYPDVVRRRWNVQWGRRERLRYSAILKLIRAASVLPESVRLLPQAKALLTD